MRITSGDELGRKMNGVWHCEQCRQVMAQWVDDSTNQYGEYIGKGSDIETKSAKKIIIDLQAMVIYINPIDDSLEKVIDMELEEYEF